MSSKEVVLTQKGLKKLEGELSYLKSVRRREVASRIKTAISFGDLSDNSEYEDAKNEQAFIEGRIITLEKMLRNARLIDHDDIKKDIVDFGSTVLLQEQESGEELEFTIVGSAESDPLDNKISNESPVGRAIFGSPVGTVVEVKTPAGVMRYKIMEIK
ncbi:MAG TPA: transcription elongation factor GreA [Firmicutes bacterium]|jgi:transcription elongation factor GreA|nr:transcription elongation factor GreA [Bacillota bacterium]